MKSSIAITVAGVGRLLSTDAESDAGSPTSAATKSSGTTIATCDLILVNPELLDLICLQSSHRLAGSLKYLAITGLPHTGQGL